jgi:sarcosine oxidase
VDALEGPALARRFPWFAFPDGTVGAYEADAGLVRPEAAVHAAIAAARTRSAELRIGTRIRLLTEDASGVSVETDQGTERAQAVIVAAGPWAARLLPELAPLLTVTRQVQVWMAPLPGTDASDMPCWLYDCGTERPAIYGLAPDPLAAPAPDGAPAPARHPKVALHGSREVVDPDVGAAPVATTEVNDLRQAYAALAPALAGARVAAATCLYTMSPDGHFLVGRRPGTRRTFFAAGLSGHGFKLAPALGDALVDLAIRGHTDLPVEFLSPARVLDRR